MPESVDTVVASNGVAKKHHLDEENDEANLNNKSKALKTENGTKRASIKGDEYSSDNAGEESNSCNENEKDGKGESENGAIAPGVVPREDDDEEEEDDDYVGEEDDDEDDEDDDEEGGDDDDDDDDEEYDNEDDGDE